MKKEIEKTVYGESKGEASIKFKDKLNSIISDNIDFFKENDINPEDIYTLTMSDFYVQFNVTNQVVAESELKKEMDKAFSESFSHLFKKA